MKNLSDESIKEFLENEPLYVWKTFDQPELERENLGVKAIDDYCESCDQVRPFHSYTMIGSGASGSGSHTMAKKKSLKSGNSTFNFSCVSCGIEKRIFLVEQIVTEETVKLQKYGQQPRKKLERNNKLKKFFKNDADNYEKALICLNNGYGVAAFAYFRRIVESNILQLLDLVVESVDQKETDNPIKIAIDELRKESPMSDKIRIANNALPEYLKPDGLNPLGTIYHLLSDGVHRLSDEECLGKAEKLQACLSFLIEELASRKRNKESFKKTIGSLKN